MTSARDNIFPPDPDATELNGYPGPSPFLHTTGRPPMITTTILEFQREFDVMQHYARREPVEITRHGRRAFVLMSAERYDWIRAASRRAHRTSNSTTPVISMVEQAEMDPEHAALDELLT